MKPRWSLGWLTIGFVVLVAAAGLVVASSDAGLPLPAAIVVAALAVCAIGILVAGVVGYRRSRAGGHGFWQSVGTGMRTAFRTFIDLF